MPLILNIDPMEGECVLGAKVIITEGIITQ